MKVCCKCKQEKELSEFGEVKKAPDGKNRTCKECCRQYRIERLKREPDFEKNYEKKWREAHPVESQLSRKRIRGRREEKRRKEDREYVSRKRKTDINFAILDNLKSRIRYLLKHRSISSNDFLGYSVEEFKKHIESLFQEGMSWENYGKEGWHLDHKKPIAAFDLTDIEQQKACFHYSNYQPLWAKDNYSKGAKYEGKNYKQIKNKEHEILCDTPEKLS